MRESYSSHLERSVGADVMTDALPDIDLYDHDNPLCVTEYVNDIYQYWYKVEVRGFHPARERERSETRCARDRKIRGGIERRRILRRAFASMCSAGHASFRTVHVHPNRHQQ